MVHTETKTMAEIMTGVDDYVVLLHTYISIVYRAVYTVYNEYRVNMVPYDGCSDTILLIFYF